MDQATRTFVIVGVAVVLGGAFFLHTGRRRVRATRQFDARATTVQAQVLELRRHELPQSTEVNNFWFAPLVRFTLADGRVVEAETMTGTNPPPARVGQVVPVRFDPDQPTRVNLATGLGRGSVLGWIHAGLGVGLIVFGALACLIGYAVSRLP